MHKAITEFVRFADAGYSPALIGRGGTSLTSFRFSETLLYRRHFSGPAHALLPYDSSITGLALEGLLAATVTGPANAEWDRVTNFAERLSAGHEPRPVPSYTLDDGRIVYVFGNGACLPGGTFRVGEHEVVVYNDTRGLLPIPSDPKAWRIPLLHDDGTRARVPRLPAQFTPEVVGAA